MDLCHVKNAELSRHLKKWKGRVVLRGEYVKANAGYRAVSTEQGASAPQTTAAKFLDTSSKFLGRTGEASAVSEYTQVKMIDAPRLLTLPENECLENRIKISPRQ